MWKKEKWLFVDPVMVEELGSGGISDSMQWWSSCKRVPEIGFHIFALFLQKFVEVGFFLLQFLME